MLTKAKSEHEETMRITVQQMDAERDRVARGLSAPSP